VVVHLQRVDVGPRLQRLGEDLHGLARRVGHRLVCGRGFYCPTVVCVVPTTKPPKKSVF
jgi:hypothetical protein